VIKRAGKLTHVVSILLPSIVNDRYHCAIDLRIENEPCRPEQACAVPALMPIRAGTAQACSGLRPCHTTQWLIFNAKINNIASPETG
jgi:hypothetical protein